jgi:hypothetical protein
MTCVRAVFVIPVLVVSLGLTASGAQPAITLSGTISTTLTITEDTRLVGDVTCAVASGPCIQIGASGVTLRLEGFSITGPVDPVAGCAGGSTGGAHGISIAGQRAVDIRGPGIVQRFRGHGISIGAGSTRVLVRQVTASTNCLSGIFITGLATRDNDLEANIAVRNGNTAAPCGGI